ncbi:BatD family protein [Coralloluteibacterium thermophilus]|uniref:BatD family protein n=1 Tax=Coralloluteibacterium thermophilum TaxID=2707049 RepID=A0ABV9NP35_9GAMM
MRRLPGCVLFVVLALLALPALAAPRAWLDRDRVVLGETVTLNIEVARATGEPDLSPLDEDFVVRGRSSSSQTRIVNGNASTSTLYGVTLEPRREGVIGIPRLRIGDVETEPLALTVAPASTRVARAGDPVFVESELETDAPYVQQSVAYTVRLYYAVTLLDGQLEAPTPDGVAVQRIGDDVTYQRSLAGRRYNVVERRFLVTPERSGTIEIPPARFRGRALGSGFDAFMQDSQVSATSGTPQTLEVRPQPADAPSPWLAVRALDLEMEPPPESGRAGEPLLVTVRLRADGATAAQLPDLGFPEVAGAQVFPEPADTREQWRDGRVQTTLSRRFAIVPRTGGTLEVPALEVGWWNVEDDRREAARLPGFEVDVAGAGVAPRAPADAAAAPVDAPVGASPGVGGAVWPWQLATLVLGLACAVLLVRDRRRVAPAASAPAATPAAGAGRGAEAARALRRALDEGDLGAVAEALVDLCGTRGRGGLEAVAGRLADPAQQAAVDALARARWGGGDPRPTREQLRSAFADGPRLRSVAPDPHREAPLPPLYPPRAR